MIQEYFRLSKDYNYEDLKKALHEKIKEINKLNIGDTDKKIYSDYAYLLYNKAKSKLYYKQIFSNPNYYTQQSSYYSEKLNPDNTRTITETIKTNKNGVEDTIIKKYKKYPDGKIEYIQPVYKKLT